MTQKEGIPGNSLLHVNVCCCVFFFLITQIQVILKCLIEEKSQINQGAQKHLTWMLNAQKRLDNKVLGNFLRNMLRGIEIIIRDLFMKS